MGCRATSLGLEDALQIVGDPIFSGEDLPRITEALEDVEVTTLDSRPVLPNREFSVRRGVWLPRGFGSLP